MCERNWQKGTVLALLLVAMLAGTGCVARRQVVVSAYRAADPAETIRSGDRVYVVPRPKPENALLDNEVRERIAAGLRAEFLETVGPERAELFVRYDYGVGPLESTTRYRRESYARTAIITTHGGDGERFISSIELPPLVTYRPDVEHSRDLWLRLEVYPGDPTAEDGPTPVWISEAHLRADTRDIRDVLDYLVAGALTPLGEDTDGSRVITIRADDPRIDGGGSD